MALNPGPGRTNGRGHRRLTSWIESFIADTANLEAPEIYRLWVAIGTLAASLEQKVWLTTSGRLYPNMYCTLVGQPGVGKTRTIIRARRYLETLVGPESDPSRGLRLAPTSMTAASLVDALSASKRIMIYRNKSPEEFHSMVLLPDEWSAFAPRWEDEFVGNLTQFYDVHPYSQWRRGKDLRVTIERPQLNIIGGATPSYLLRYLPEYSWDQGFTSRLMLIYHSKPGERVDDFAPERREKTLHKDMVADLAQVYGLAGEFTVAQEFADEVNAWRSREEKPRPDHPKLEHYCTRRRAHLYKLAMVANVDRGNSLTIDASDFHRALVWLEEVEINMGNLFDAGSTNTDAIAMDEIVAYVRRLGHCSKERAVAYTCRKVPQYAVLKVLDLLIHSGRLAWDEKSKTFECID